MANRKPWTDHEVEVLKERWDAKDSAIAIAERLGRSRNSVCGKLKKLGLFTGTRGPTPENSTALNPTPRSTVITLPQLEYMKRRDITND